MEFFKMIFLNLLGYDALIIAAGVFSLYLYKSCYDSSKKISSEFYITLGKHHNPKEKIHEKKLDFTKEELDSIEQEHNKVINLFSKYESIVSIFPFMGILGTVLSLMRVMDFSDSSIIMSSFSSALTSTFWGLVWAIISKLREGGLISLLNQNDSALNTAIERNVLAERSEVI